LKGSVGVVDLRVRDGDLMVDDSEVNVWNNINAAIFNNNNGDGSVSNDKRAVESCLVLF